MSSRRKFLEKSLGGAIGLTFAPLLMHGVPPAAPDGPIVLSTWNNKKANQAAWSAVESGKSALDVVEIGVKTVEADPKDMSVGYGGRPDRDGNVTLDASIMNAEGDCGSVCFLQDIKHPIAVARKVMETTPHVMLAGEGAQQFALENGFEAENLLTPEAESAWKNWQKEAKYKPIINIENHDTIGMLAMDKNGDLSGACTTSGLAFKMHGRVGDSPIIGAGLFVDNEVGGAVATGMGEAIVKVCGSFLVVELMRQGRTAEEACKAAVERVVKKQKGHKDFQVCFLALRKDGTYGGYALHKGFMYVVSTQAVPTVMDSLHYLKS
ncbi:MAG: N(4)-(beta-N-acetylglucosaminyl)-L-asparaginase [Phaeodactylibacter sp.]|uniref:N(4)-(beta-N-acetylglucosaminyl)-L-asparaginase n=1 Tax=Phaeodactylibacter sp. TaxID=1940289 RepID=UPI0032F0354B